MKQKLVIGAVISGILLVGAAFVCIKYYEFVFAKTVKGEIIRVERVTAADAIVAGGRQVPPEQLFSFAVAIKDETGEIHTASSEDRQWAVASAGQCAVAKFFPYPPWEFRKSGTYHGARLEHLSDCK